MISPISRNSGFNIYQSPPFPLRKQKGCCSCCQRGKYRPITTIACKPPKSATVADKDGWRWVGWVGLCLVCAKAFGKAAE